MRNLREEKEILKNWKGDSSKPLVSISCITYNHEKYIEDAFEGFLIQETDFPLEILIHDDASTDGTSEIIRDYERKYPDVIKPIYQKENQYSQGRKISVTYQYPRARGKYIALCEGDDYWTDPLKLQKQVDFLESHEDFVLCAGMSLVDDGYSLQDFWSLQTGTINFRDIAISNFIVTNTVIFRNIFADNTPSKFVDYCSKVLNGDIFLYLSLLLSGKGYIIPEKMGVYRLHDGGIMSRKPDAERYLCSLKTRNVIIEYLKDIHADHSCLEDVERGCAFLMEGYLKNNLLTKEFVWTVPHHILKAAVYKCPDNHQTNMNILMNEYEIINKASHNVPAAALCGKGQNAKQVLRNLSGAFVENFCLKCDLFINFGKISSVFSALAETANKNIRIISVDSFINSHDSTNLVDLLISEHGERIFVRISDNGNELAILNAIGANLLQSVDISFLLDLNPELLEQSGHSCKSLIDYMAAKGFSVFGIDDQDSKYYPLEVAGNLEKLKAKNSFFNVLCIKKEKTLSVAFFSHGAALTGAERSLADLVEDLCNDSVLCSVLLPSDGPLKEVLLDKGAAVYVVPEAECWWVDNKNIFSKENLKPRLARSMLATVTKALPILKQLNPDVIYSQTTVAPWGALCAEILSIPHVLSVCEYGELDHQFKYYFGFRESIKAMYDSSHAIFSITKSVRDEVFREINDKDNKIEVVYRNVRLAPLNDLKVTPCHYDYKNKPEIKIAIFGTVHEGKGQEDIVRAGIELMKRGRKVKIYIFGYSDPHYLAFIKDLIDASAYKENFIIKDFVNNPIEQMKEMDIIVSCSRNEAFGRTLFEAILLDKPIVYSNSGGPKEIFIDEEHGLAYKPADAYSLAEKLIFVMDHLDKTQQRVKTAKEYVLKRFNRENYSGKIKSRLKQIKGTKINTCQSVQALFWVDFLVDALQSELERKDSELDTIHNGLAKKVAEREVKITSLSEAVTERDNQIAGLVKTIESLIIDRDSWKMGYEHLQCPFRQLSDERDSQVLKLNQAVAVCEGQITDLKQALAGRDLLIDDFKQTVNDRENQIILLNAEKNKITSSHSWKITMPLRFAGRLLRGDWVAVQASFVSLRNARRIPFVMEEETSTNKDVDLKNDAGSPKNDANNSSDRVPFRNKRILLVSYFCPSRAHAGGLRILDIYSLIKSTFPHVQLDLFTHKRPAIDWSYEDVENIFDNIFLSPVEDLSVCGFHQLHKLTSSYDVIDLQFHQAGYDIESWRTVGKKIIYTPMESLLRGLLIAFRHLDIFSVQKILRNIMLAKEELMFVKKADEVVCVSEKDASSLRMFCHAVQICALETAVSNIEFSDAVELKYGDITPEQKQPIILYIAYFGSETNINALKWYIVNVHSLISKTLPGYKLQVVGRGDLSVFKDYQSPSIEFVGEVPRLSTYIQNAKVGIAPAINGGGFRGKINQYAIYGVPVVASKIAAEGLVYKDKVDIFITDQDSVFAERCIRLLQDNDLNRLMGHKARDQAFAQYTWESKMDTIKKIYNLEATET